LYLKTQGVNWIRITWDWIHRLGLVDTKMNFRVP
jgi:hypothetical protein